jgi:anti-sigma regulatory factor (Ser/Thr protein kinase)
MPVDPASSSIAADTGSQTDGRAEFRMPSRPRPNNTEQLKQTIARLTEELREARDTIARLSSVPKHVVLPPAKGENAEVRSLLQTLQRQAMLLERDNAVARKLQTSLQPLWFTDFEGINFELESIPGARVGGDFYDVIKISDSTIGLLIADVSGSGLPAAVIMATARMAFRTFATIESSPRAILKKVNDALLDATLAGHYLTAFFGLLDTEMLTLQYVNASHCPPYLVRQDSIIALDTEGLFVGMLEEPDYEQKSIQLERNDRLFLYTDGLLRALAGEANGKAMAVLQEYLHENAGRSLGELIHGLSRRFTRELEDDIALLAVELRKPRSTHKTIVIASAPMEVVRVQDAILPSLAAKGFGERTIFAVKLAVEEAVINAIKHGNQLDPTKKVTVDFTLEDDKVVISVADEGEGFDPSSIPDPTTDENLESPYGRGIVLMKAYMDSVEFSDNGTKVTMTKYAPWHEQKP